MFFRLCRKNTTPGAQPLNGVHLQWALLSQGEKRTQPRASPCWWGFSVFRRRRKTEKPHSNQVARELRSLALPAAPPPLRGATPSQGTPVGVYGNQLPSRSPFGWSLLFSDEVGKQQTPPLFCKAASRYWKWMIRRKSSALSDAPPTSAPSISGCAISSSTLPGLTLPPY